MTSMPHKIDQVLLKPGDSLRFGDRDALLESLDRLDRRVPSRSQGCTRDHREHFCIVRYLRRLAGEGLLQLPVTLTKTPEGQDPPDFVLEWPNGEPETFEVTEGSTSEYQRALSNAGPDSDELLLPVDINTPHREAVELWADVIFSAFRRKATALVTGRYQIDHLLIYDLTGLSLLVPLEEGAPGLRRKIERWYRREQPGHRFAQVSVLRDQALLLDVTGEARVLHGESPYFSLPVIRAEDEDDLRRRLRDIDRYCRVNFIRHLKLFGSILGDRDDEVDTLDDTEPHGFRVGSSDLDLLVEFEPGTRVTLLDMARMERELSDLTGFKVDLRTAGELSRYFRENVLSEAVELRAQRA